mmetsp:Transcript_10870/g.23004  ORF Transcript_10870/g.23004 Transcript_10870/m.23004 type:complete len:507 (-) Transcript_10870:20-1540(-)
MSDDASNLPSGCAGESRIIAACSHSSAAATGTCSGSRSTDTSTTNNLLHVSGLIKIASLTNSELFGKVISVIKCNIDNQQRQWISTSSTASASGGQAAVIEIIEKAAVGTTGYCSQDDWIRAFVNLYQSHNEEESRTCDADDDHCEKNTSRGVNYGEALKNLPADAHGRRMRAAFHALDMVQSSPPSLQYTMSVRQAVGLVRGAAYIGDAQLQTQAILHLVRVLPRLMSHPHAMFAAVQTPILRMLKWEAFENGGLSFTPCSKQKFQAVLDCDRGSEAEDRCEGNSRGDIDVNKRKRPWEDEHASQTPVTSSCINEESTCTLMLRLVEAATLARRGNQRGSKHGCVLCVPIDSMDSTHSSRDVHVQRIIGRGWNHNILLGPGKGKNKIVLHSEVHAVADAIRTYGEATCFDKLFPRATVVIAELVGDYAYESCHPCPKCNTFLKGVGITQAIHSTPRGVVGETDMGPANPKLLERDVARVPFRAACDEMNLCCKRLEHVEKNGPGR